MPLKVVAVYKVIIAGSRSFNDYPLLKSKVDEFFHRLDRKDIEIVSGTARGADKLGERYAVEKGYKLTRFPAEWDKYGKSAGYRRNAEMAKYADACIVFWDGKSKGTLHMINLARKAGLILEVVRF